MLKSDQVRALESMSQTIDSDLNVNDTPNVCSTDLFV